MNPVPSTRRLWALLLVAAPLVVAAADPSSESSDTSLSNSQIQQALKPPGMHEPATRGLRRRSDTSGSVSLNIAFEYNSSALRPEASAQLQQLQLALASDSLRQDRFLVAGHTDAKGNPQYNQKLSLQRAESVKRFLTAHGIADGRLDTIGYGSEHLLDPDQPDDPRNRRVEIRDLGAAR